MGSRFSEQKRRHRLARGVLVAAVLAYAAVRIGFLYVGLQMASTASLRETVDQYSGLLKAVDELLVLSAVLGGWAFYNARGSRVRNGRTLTGLAAASFALMMIGWVVIALGTGRLGLSRQWTFCRRRRRPPGGFGWDLRRVAPVRHHARGIHDRLGRVVVPAPVEVQRGSHRAGADPQHLLRATREADPHAGGDRAFDGVVADARRFQRGPATRALEWEEWGIPLPGR